MAAKKKQKKNDATERELSKLIARLSKPGADRWEADSARVRHLLSLDAARVMRRLSSKQDEAVSLFSRLRTRDALIELCRSDFTTATFTDLARLDPKEQTAVQHFHDLLHELRWYVSYTEDMPSAVKTTVAQYVRRLDELHHVINATLGSPEAQGHRVVQG